MRKYLILPIFLVLVVSQASAGWFDSGGQAAVIKLSGSITPSSQTGLGATSSITPEKIRNLNAQAIRNNAQAIIYEWNSGGGAVVASKEIRREIESVKIPTVCRFRDLAASGAYLASLSCDRIVADSASITGSIGVRSSYLEFSGLLDKYGVEYVNISSGSLKEAGSQFTNLSEQERQLLQEKVDKLGNQFISEVAQERDLNSSEVKKVEKGQIFLGSEAKRLGLVDTLGGRKTAVDVAGNMTGRQLTTFEVETGSSFSFLSLLGSDSLLKKFLSNGESPVKAEWR
ncbi:MAG: signal peptide peptidase SppA [Nanohaloarchaea archaeon]|nr:signal peptide peptidase SppA [Candidatus Nanohaloarchaea archaeon]